MGSSVKAILFILITFAWVNICHAADIVDIDPSTVYIVKDTKNKNREITCALVGDAYLSGKVISGNRFRLSSFDANKLATKIKKLKKKRQTSKIPPLKKKLSKARKEYKAKDALCKAGAPAAPPAATPTPSSDAFSMSKLNRNVNFEDVRYLSEKAGFGFSNRENWLVDIGLNQGVDALVDNFMSTRDEDPGVLERVENLTDNDLGGNFQQTQAGQRKALFDLWVHTNNSYAERMALFLLSVWTVSGDVIGDETFRSVFWQYYKRLQAYSYANTYLPDLGVEITRDPLMLIYLNNELNVRGNPNENYARELMELFTLGPVTLDGTPNYSETKPDGSGDIAVAAKMLTGWYVHFNYSTNTLDPNFSNNRHELGPHTMFVGTSYQFSGEDDQELVRGIFANHPGVSIYYSTEILKEYLTPDPSPELIESFARIIEEQNFNLRPAMNILLKSQAFYHPNYKDSLPKNSIEYAVEVVKVLGMEDAYNPDNVDWRMGGMGMHINLSPSVFWFNPASWTSPSVSLERANFIHDLLSDSTSQQASDPDWSVANILPSGAASSSDVINHVASKLGVHNVPATVSDEINLYMNRARQYDGTFNAQPFNNQNINIQRQKGAGAYYILMASPYFQLK